MPSLAKQAHQGTPCTALDTCKDISSKPLIPELTLDVLDWADDVNLATIMEFDQFVPLDLELDVIASPAGLWLAGAMEDEEPICALSITSWHPLLHCSVPDSTRTCLQQAISLSDGKNS